MHKNNLISLKPSFTKLFILLAMLLSLSLWISSINAAPMNQKCIAAAVTWTWDDWPHFDVRYALAIRTANTCEEARYLAQEIAKSLARTRHGATIATTDPANGKPAVCAAFYRIIGLFPDSRAENGKDLTKLKPYMKLWGDSNHTLCASLQQPILAPQNQMATGTINVK